MNIQEKFCVQPLPEECLTLSNIDMTWGNIEGPEGVLECTRLLVNYLCCLKMLNLVENPSYIAQVIQCEEFRKIEADYQVEAVKMRSELICKDRTVKFSDILTENLYEVAVQLNVDDITKRLNEENFEKTFPMYSGMLKQRIKKGVKFTKLLSKGYESLMVLLGDERLPHTFLDKLMKSLTKNDIKNLIEITET